MGAVRDPNAISPDELGRQMKSKQMQMAQAEERWLALSEELDAIGQQSTA